MTDDVNFREEAVDEAFNKNKKTFLAILPLGSNVNFIFFSLFIIFSIISLIIIEIPIKINAIGVLELSNKDSHITFEYDGYRVKKINKQNGEILKKGEPILILEKNYSYSNKNNIKINLSHLEELKSLLIETNNSHLKNKKVLSEIYNKQKDITKIIEKEVDIKEKFSINATKNHNNGLVINEYLEEKQNELQASKFKLAESQQSEIKHLQAILEEDNKNKVYIAQVNAEIKATQGLILEQKKEKEPIIIASPCNCSIDRVSIKEGSIIKKDELLVTLKNKSKKDITGILYVSTMNFGDIDKNSSLNIKVDSYPFLKFGTIKGDIKYISHSPINEQYIKNKNITGSHYLIQSSIKNIPDNISLKDGMSIQAHIVTKTVPLYKFLFEKM